MFLLFLALIVRYYDQYSNITMVTQTTSTKIKETITKIAELQAVKRHYNNTLDELESVLIKKDSIENQMIKELEDINDLEKLGVKSIFYKILGNQEEQLEKERQEYLQVTLQYKEIRNAIEVVEFEKNILEKKVVTIDDLANELEGLKQLRSDEILSIPSELRNRLVFIHKKKDDLKKYEVELKEAFAMGSQTIGSLEKVLAQLKRARGWGNKDMMSGNVRYVKSMKHGAIDRAMNEVSRTKLLLHSFNRELADIGYSNQRLGLQVENIARFPGVIFDNLISDWIVQNKIKGVLSTVSNLMDDVHLIMQSIQKDMRQSSADYDKFDLEENRLLEQN
ncbi:MAG: hypothetical protein ACJATI_001527 [Halioglobus sp.]|jgi:hypothetical protein